MLTVIIITLIIHDEVWNSKQQNDKNDLCWRQQWQEWLAENLAFE